MLCLAGQVRADEAFLEHYKSGLDAIESEEWSQAAKLMQKAIGQRRAEARRLPKYLHFKPYMPHFYLGVARFERGDCSGALRAWKTSEKQGVVNRRPQYSQIELAREVCRNRQRAAPPPSAPVPSRPISRTPPPPQILAQPLPARTIPRAPGEQDLTPTSRGWHDEVPIPTEPPSAALLAAAGAFFEGSYQKTLDRLASAELIDPYAQAHANLLRAAAEFALYMATGEQSRPILESARQHVLEARKALPDLELPDRHFSPRFLDFFYGQRLEEDN
jgi:hypothetical protein